MGFTKKQRREQRQYHRERLGNPNLAIQRNASKKRTRLPGEEKTGQNPPNEEKTGQNTPEEE